MTYFQNIHSLADLRKEYRRLALEHHPGKDSDTAIVQQVNIGFGRLLEAWKDKPDIPVTSTGHEYDYSGATTKEYTEYVYNGYRWRGRNYRGRHAPEIVALTRTWLKETYPGYEFSVRQENCHPTHVRLMKADFKAFTKKSGKVQGDINHYHIDSDKYLTNKAKDIMMSTCDFTMSYNFDDSDPMTDYFHTSFCLTLGVGSYKQPYKVEPPRLDSKDKPEVSKHPGGPTHKAMRRALGKARFGFIESRKYARETILREDCFGSRGGLYFWPKEYSSAKMAQKRIDELEKVGIRYELAGYNEGYIRPLGYTPEMRGSLERECQKYAAVYQAWYSRQNLKTI